MVRSPKEINTLSILLKKTGFILENDQPHINGERFLASPDKLVLVGRRAKDNQKVIIKTSSFKRAKEEIKQEKKVRDIISKFPPFKKAILIPEQYFFGKRGKYQIFVTKFIDQEKVFIAHSLTKQFETIVNAYKLREPLNGNTFEVVKKMYSKFPRIKASEYIKSYRKFQKSVLKKYRTQGLESAMNEGFDFVRENKKEIESGCEHLVHSDFAPHNFRLSGDSLYTLDCSAFIFGHKHEELARLINYMTIHNYELGTKIKNYIFNKKGEKEYLNLRLMMAYKIQFLLNFYTESLKKTKDELLALTTLRVSFWEEVLRCVVNDRDLDENVLAVYKANAATLRTEEEKARQREFAKA